MILPRYSRFMKHRTAVTPCSSFLRLSLYEESEVSKMSGLDEVYDAVEAGVAQERHPVVISKHRISSKRPFYRDGEKKVRPLRSERSSRLDRLRFATLDSWTRHKDGRSMRPPLQLYHTIPFGLAISSPAKSQSMFVCMRR